MSDVREQWNPTARGGEGVTVSEAVGQALGSASVCWVGGTGDLEFDSARCADIHDGLMAWLMDWEAEHRKEANAATAAKLGFVTNGAPATLNEVDPEFVKVLAAWAAKLGTTAVVRAAIMYKLEDDNR